MMFGVVLVGTYTSVFIASPILIYLGVGANRGHGRDDTPDEEPEPAPAKPAAKPSQRPAARARR
jgi:preprotein translocase subunit SecF